MCVEVVAIFKQLEERRFLFLIGRCCFRPQFKEVRVVEVLKDNAISDLLRDQGYLKGKYEIEWKID